MKYNFIETNDLIEDILKNNNVSIKELNKDYDFIVDDEVFLNFKNKLLELKDKKFLIIGDYDCDGICATTIIKKLLEYLNISVNYYIPSRIKDGYGINNNLVKMAYDNRFDVLLLVDNGIVASESIDYANSLGLKVLIIDHHEYQSLPNAYAIIHCNIVNEKYSKLSAGGLSYVLSSLFYQDDLSLVLGGLTTLSDMMSVIGFNRTLIKTMLNKLLENKIYQLNILNDYKEFTYDNLSFTVIPKINCLSRMEPLANPNILVKYFFENENNCLLINQKINELNETRKKLSSDMASTTLNLLRNEDIEVIASSDFKEGLCGLVANKVVRDINRPIIILSKQDDLYKGSGRSIDGFNLYDALKDFDGYDTFGGHQGAIGLSIKQENYQAFLVYVKDIKVIDKAYTDAYLIDENINYDIIDKIDALRPFGTDLKEPLIAIKNNNARKMIVAGKYPKYLINNNLSAISFHPNSIEEPKYFVGRLSKDTYHKEAITLLIEDLF